jgi:hypothetical protein
MTRCGQYAYRQLNAAHDQRLRARLLRAAAGFVLVTPTSVSRRCVEVAGPISR